METYRYAVITPVRDEEAHISKTIKSMVNQTLLPVQWVIVDDGSTDRTSKIIDEASLKYPWIEIVHRCNRGFRKSGGGVVEAFEEGYAKLTKDWEYLVKLDGDLSFDRHYFERCLEQFRVDPTLGLGGGRVCVEVNGKTVTDSPGDPQFHVRGATKLYRKECWKKISPLVKSPGWDTIDEVKANMYGWKTRTFDDLVLLQHKHTGSADGIWKNNFKNGMGSYLTGYLPIFMIAKCIKRAMRKPYLIGSVALFAGYLSGYFSCATHLPEKQVISFLRKQQLRRLFLRQSIYR